MMLFHDVNSNLQLIGIPWNLPNSRCKTMEFLVGDKHSGGFQGNKAGINHEVLVIYLRLKYQIPIH